MLTKQAAKKALLGVLLAIIVTVAVAPLLRGCDGKQATLNEVTIQTNQKVNEDKQNAQALNQAIDTLPTGGLIDRLLPPVSTNRSGTGQERIETSNTTDADAERKDIRRHQKDSQLGVTRELSLDAILGGEATELLPLPTAAIEPPMRYMPKPLWYLPKTPQKHLNRLNHLNPCYGIPDCTVPDNE